MAKPKQATSEGKALRETGKKWLDRIQAAGKAEKTWMDDAAVAVGVYTGEGGKVETATASENAAYDFNILFSNVETIVPAIINSPPAPDIRRRFGADDPVAKDLAEIIERVIRVQVDDSKLQVEMEAMAQDAFLPGRGIIRLRFMSDFEGGETTDAELAEARKGENADNSDTGEYERPASPAPTERSTNERITFEAVSWKDYRHGPAKRWDDRPWDAFRHSIPPDEYEEFSDAALFASQSAEDDPARDADTDCTVWEVWDKKSKTVLFIDSNSGKVLKKVPDPLGLSKFFPIATPVQAIEITGRLMPVTPFSIYRKLADELDITTKRIRVITKQMKVKGWYGISPTDVQAVLDADDNEFVPIADAEIWAANGGLQSAVLFWPVEKLIVVLAQLYQVREQTKQAIFEITGISDIVRGASNAMETLGAQQIKSQWGSLQIQKMQRQMERAARDLFVMMAEVIPAKFSPETIQKITDIQLVPTEQDMTPAPPPQFPADMPPEAQQQAMQEAQQAEQARTAKLQHLMTLRALMKEKAASYYRIDVESDSTVKADLTRQKQELAEFMQAASSYFGAVGPLIQQGALPMELAMEIFSSFARMFNMGKSVEDAVDQMIAMAKEKAGQPPPNPEQEKAAAAEKAKQETVAAELQMKQQEAQTKAQAATIEGQIKQAQAQAEIQRKAAEQQTQSQIALMKQQDESNRMRVENDERNLDMDVKRVDLEIRRTDLQIKQTDLGIKRQQALQPAQPTGAFNE